MKRTRRRAFSCEALEERSLLSGFGGASRVAAVHASQAIPGGTGASAGLSVNQAPSATDYQALQQVTSTNNLAMFLSQLALLADGHADVQVGPLSVLNNSRDLDLRINDVASSLGVTVPADISDADEPTAQRVVASVHTAGFESTLLTALVQTETQLSRELPAFVTGSQNPTLNAFGQGTAYLAHINLATSRALLTGGPLTSASNLGSAPTSSTLSAGDLQTLGQSYSATVLEHFLAQLTDLQSNNTSVDRYAEKLLSDHEMEDVQLGRYAAATGTFLPANFVGKDAQTAGQVLAYANRGNYTLKYLHTMVTTHTQDIQDNQKTIATTANPVLKQFATDDIPTDWLHRAGALHLLSH